MRAYQTLAIRALTIVLCASAMAALCLAIVVRSASGKTGGAAEKTSSEIVFPHGPDFNCAKHARTFVYLFWPKGHSGHGAPSQFTPPMPSRQPNPGPPEVLAGGAHMSVWLGGGNYANGSLRLMVGATTGYFANFGQCPINPRGRVDGTIAHSVQTSTATALSCKFQSRYGYVGLATQNLLRTVLAHDKRRLFLYAQLRPSNSRLTYDSKFCKRISLPAG